MSYSCQYLNDFMELTWRFVGCPRYHRRFVRCREAIPELIRSVSRCFGCIGWTLWYPGYPCRGFPTTTTTTTTTTITWGERIVDVDSIGDGDHPASFDIATLRGNLPTMRSAFGKKSWRDWDLQKLEVQDFQWWHLTMQSPQDTRSWCIIAY